VHEHPDYAMLNSAQPYPSNPEECMKHILALTLLSIWCISITGSASKVEPKNNTQSQVIDLSTELSDLKRALEDETYCNTYCARWAHNYPYNVDELPNPELRGTTWGSLISHAFCSPGREELAYKVAQLVQEKRSDSWALWKMLFMKWKRSLTISTMGYHYDATALKRMIALFRLKPIDVDSVILYAHTSMGDELNTLLMLGPSAALPFALFAYAYRTRKCCSAMKTLAERRTSMSL